MDVGFSDLTYVIKTKWRNKETRTLLHGISGSFRSGQLSAIMGPSGAGKSTLLNILSGYWSREEVQGEITVNGRRLDSRLFHKSSRYISQEDLLPDLLTTRETMMFAADLKLSRETAREQKRKEIEHILGLLGLTECGDTQVEKLSGGQRKRLSIALEMIHNPRVFFLDEPTSGLDNVSTKQCLQLLSKLAKQKRTIVCTIHQPSASLFELFDHIYILGSGRCVYQGSVDHLLPFLSSAGFHCPTYHSPPDFVMELVDSCAENISVLSRAIDNGKICYSSNAGVNKEPKKNGWSSRELNSVICYDQYADADDYPTSSTRQFLILLRRMLQQNLRNKTALQISFLHHLGCALLFGSVFFKSANDAHQMFNHMKFCVGYVLFYTYTSIMLPVLIHPSQVKLLKKEYFNRWYRLNPYYIALVVSKLPTQILFGFMFCVQVYFMAGLPAQPTRFTLFFLIGFIVTLVADAVGMTIGSTFNVTNGSAVGPAVIAPLLGLAVYGFDFAREVPLLIYAIMKLSFIRCGVVATAITLFGLDRATLECTEVYCHFKEPKLILRFLDVENVSVWNDISALFINLIVLRAVNYFALRHRVSIK